MSDDLHDDLPPSLRALITAEREAPAGTRTERDAIRSRIAITVGVAATLGGAAKAAAGGATTATTAVGAGKVIALVVAAVIAGGAVVAVVASRAPSRPPSARPEVPALVSPPPVVQRVVPARDLPDAANEPVAAPVERARITPVTPPSPPATRAPRRAPQEAEILGEANRAMSRGDPAGALDSLEAHVRAFPDGPLAEERDALRIEALLALGRIEDARRAATAFAARYPNSIHQHIVDRATQESPP